MLLKTIFTCKVEHQSQKHNSYKSVILITVYYYHLPWFMDLTFQVPLQYCSLQHQPSLPPPVTSTTGHCFCCGSVSSTFLELFLHWSPVAYWTPTHLGSSSFSVLYFYHFILFMGFWRQEYWSGLPFPSPVAIMLYKRVQNAVLGCNLKNDRMISVCLQGKPFNITVIQVYAPTSNTEETEVEWFYEDLQDL